MLFGHNGMVDRLILLIIRLVALFPVLETGCFRLLSCLFPERFATRLSVLWIVFSKSIEVEHSHERPGQRRALDDGLKELLLRFENLRSFISLRDRNGLVVISHQDRHHRCNGAARLFC